MDYVETVLKLEAEWPPERLRQYILDYLRNSCQWAQQKKMELELDNRDARMLGVPYSQRKAISVKIDALDQLFAKWRARGIEYKNLEIKVSDIVQPEDLSYIQGMGFEWHLRSAIIF